MTWPRFLPAPHLILAACSAAATLALLTVAPNIQPDTVSYLSFHPERGVLYTLVLELFRLATPADTTLAWVARFQGACIAAAAGFFTLRTGRSLRLSASWRHGLYLLITLPSIAFAGNILTEPLAYSGIFLFWALYLEFYRTPGFRSAMGLSMLCTLLTVHRPHLLPLTAFFGLTQLLALARPKRLPHVIALGLLALCLVSANVIQNHIRAQALGQAQRTTTVGSHLLANLLYVAQQQDADLFKDAYQRKVFQEAFKLAGELGYTRGKWDKTVSHIPTSINRIFYLAVLPLCQEQASLSGSGEGSADMLALKIGLTLLKQRWTDYLSLLARKVYDSQPLFYVLTTVLLALGLAHEQRTGAWQGRFIVLVALATVMSIMPSLLLVVLDKRFVFLAEYPLVVWVAALGASVLEGPGKCRSVVDQRGSDGDGRPEA